MTGRVLAAALLLASPALGAASLEERIESHVKRERALGRLSQDERTAWVVYDLTSETKLASINEDLPFQAASLVKPLLALAYFHEAAAGRLGYGPDARRRMEAMIQRSSNLATNRVMRRLGGPAAVQALLRRHYGGILRELRLVEYIPPGGRTYRNLASAHDYSRFLHALWNGGLPRAAELRRLMHLPNRDRIYTGAREVPEGTLVYDKSGSTGRLCGDMGVLVARGRDGRSYPYIMVALIEKRRPARDYPRWIRSRGDVIRRVSNLVYAEIAARHGLLADARPRP